MPSHVRREQTRFAAGGVVVSGLGMVGRVLVGLVAAFALLASGTVTANANTGASAAAGGWGVDALAGGAVSSGVPAGVVLGFVPGGGLAHAAGVDVGVHALPGGLGQAVAGALGTDTPAVRRGNEYHFANSLCGGPVDQVISYGVLRIWCWLRTGTDLHQPPRLPRLRSRARKSAMGLPHWGYLGLLFLVLAPYNMRLPMLGVLLGRAFGRGGTHRPSTTTEGNQTQLVSLAGW